MTGRASEREGCTFSNQVLQLIYLAILLFLLLLLEQNSMEIRAGRERKREREKERKKQGTDIRCARDCLWLSIPLVVVVVVVIPAPTCLLLQSKLDMSR